MASERAQDAISRVRALGPDNYVRAYHRAYGVPPRLAMAIYRMRPIEGRELTDRQMEVLDLYARGFRERGVAVELGIGSETVREHRARVVAKLGARNITNAVAIAVSRGLVTLDL